MDILSEDEFAKKGNTIVEKNHVSFVDRVRGDRERLKQEEDGAQAAVIAQSMVDSDIDAPDHQLRASELAKILKIKTKELIDRAQSMGIEISSARSVLTPSQVELLKEKI